MTNDVADRTGPTQDSLERWNFKVMLGTGTIYGSSGQLADTKTVLPFLYASFGAPVLFVGLLYPLAQLARIVTQIFGAAVFGSARRSRQYQVVSFLLIGGALAALALLAPRTPGVMLVLLFMATAVALGGGKGMNYLAWSNMVRRVFSDDRRNALLYASSGVAGLLTIPIALFLQSGVQFDNALEKNLTLLWAAAAITLFAGSLLFFIREPEDALDAIERKPAPEDPSCASSFFATFRAQYAETLKANWFRHFLFLRLLLLSAELAPAFYAVHAAALHKHSAGSLNTFVIATGIAYAVGAPVWRRTGRVSDGRVLVLGALFAAFAGIWAISIEYMPSICTPLTYSLVFFLIAFANIGITNARTSMLLKAAPPDRQAYFVGLDATSATALGIVVALVFGAMARLQGPVCAILGIIGVNILAAICAARIRPPATA